MSEVHTEAEVVAESDSVSGRFGKEDRIPNPAG